MSGLTRSLSKAASAAVFWVKASKAEKGLVILRDLERQQAAEALKALQWDVELMMRLSPSQRRAIDAAVRVLDRSRIVDSLRALLPPGHPLAE